MARVTELFKFYYSKLLKSKNFLMLIDSLFMAPRPVVKCRISRVGGGGGLPKRVSREKSFLFLFVSSAFFRPPPVIKCGARGGGGGGGLQTRFPDYRISCPALLSL